MEASLNQFHEHNVRKIWEWEYEILMEKFFKGAETKFSEFQLRLAKVAQKIVSTHNVFRDSELSKHSKQP